MGEDAARLEELENRVACLEAMVRHLQEQLRRAAGLMRAAAEEPSQKRRD